MNSDKAIAKDKLGSPFLRPLSIVFIFTVSISNAYAEWVDKVADISIQYLSNSNLNTSAFNADEESDVGIVPRISLGRYFQATDLTRLRLTVDLSTEAYSDFDKFNSTTVMAALALRHKFGIGPRQPWVRANLAAGQVDADVDIRDSDLFEIGLRFGRRFAERIDSSIGFRFNSRDGGTGEVVDPAISTNVFDIESLAIDGAVNYLLTNNSLLSLTYTLRSGEFDSACTVPNVGTVLANEQVKAITFDDVFGGCVYRLEGNSSSINVNYGYALSRHSALNFGIEYRNGKADVLGYETSIFRTSFNYSY